MMLTERQDGLSLPQPDNSREEFMATIASATFETGLDNHAAWYGSTAVRDNASAHGGSYSLLCTATAAGAGVHLSNYPYFIAPSLTTHTFSLWYIEAAGTMGTISLKVLWYDSSHALLSSDILSLVRATSWTNYNTTLFSPSGTKYMGLEYTWTGTGNAWRLDDLSITVPDSPNAWLMLI